MHVDAAIERRQSSPEDVLCQSIARQHLARVAYERVEEPELGHGQAEGPLVVPRLVRGDVQGHIPAWIRGASPLGRARRRIARTRAISSRVLNGFGR